jgi:hypothetical protein
MLRISKQRGYKSFVFILMREWTRTAQFRGRVITVRVRLLLVNNKSEASEWAGPTQRRCGRGEIWVEKKLGSEKP